MYTKYKLNQYSTASSVGYFSLPSVFIPSSQVKVEWNSPARPNGEIVSYTVHHKDPVQLDITSTLITPDESDFSARVTTLHGLAAYHR